MSLADIDSLYDSHEILNALVKASQKHTSELAVKALQEFNESGLTSEEFNKEKYRDNGELFSRINEDGRVQIQMITKLPENPNRPIRAEKVLELYNDNLSVKDIAETLKRTEKWVKQNLSKFGIKFTPKGEKRINPLGIPYGWKEKDGRLILNDTEQWVLDKVEQDLKNKMLPKKICMSLNRLKIKPRLENKWREDIVMEAVKINNKMKSLLKDSF